jgi:hypothetical protein
LTTIKPSGTLSIVAGVSSGMHAIRSKYFIRRVRLAKNKVDMIEVLRNHGIKVKDDFYQANTTVVTSFPIKYSKDVKTKQEFTFDQQAELFLLLQKYWSDNAVSVTLEFLDSEVDNLKQFIMTNRDIIKGAAFLSAEQRKSYRQMPQQIITEEKYNEMMKNVIPITDKAFLTNQEKIEEEIDNYCSAESCMR